MRIPKVSIVYISCYHGNCEIALGDKCYSKIIQSSSLPRMWKGFVHNYSMTRDRILGNDCPQFETLLHDCGKSLHIRPV